MKLQDLASKPQLKEIIIDDVDIVEKYGDNLTFYVYDRLPVETYTALATVKQDDAGEMYQLVKNLILNDAGDPVIQGDVTLPVDVMNAAIMKVTENLGK